MSPLFFRSALNGGARTRTCNAILARRLNTSELKDYGPRQMLKPRGDVTVDTHTMGTSLHRYLDIKMHQSILARPWEKIVVEGSHSRSNGSILFAGEKRDKPFNWQRPTARIDNDVLTLQCLPGADHVRHYAEIIATYLNITPNAALTPADRVFYKVPSDLMTINAFRDTNLREIPRADIVVLGLVHRLDRLTTVSHWRPGSGSTYDICDWTIRQFGNRKVAFIGVRPSFWGNICESLVRLLVDQLGARQVLYFGKLGSVQRGIRPNRYLATGEASLVEGERVTWSNVLAGSLQEVKSVPVLRGDHVTLPSVLLETKKWLKNLSEGYAFVDPEVGMMARAARDIGVGFGYLHIVSDNVCGGYEEDLSNEREASVLKGRQTLFEEVQRILGHHLQMFQLCIPYERLNPCDTLVDTRIPHYFLLQRVHDDLTKLGVAAEDDAMRIEHVEQASHCPFVAGVDNTGAQRGARAPEGAPDEELTHCIEGDGDSLVEFDHVGSGTEGDRRGVLDEWDFPGLGGLATFVVKVDDAGRRPAENAAEREVDATGLRLAFGRDETADEIAA
ncbi:hypothetical protein GGX14DRAFT_544789 [Mycena pura]|uniref:Uncharacterized protein n=1 Tax=Mycena pura TaxID=153505 RepID=A0AAD6V6K3_9AGAR|nr:hypothetical protein GGX14DRAFT_544789 [Mycena pura]